MWGVCRATLLFSLIFQLHKQPIPGCVYEAELVLTYVCSGGGGVTSLELVIELSLVYLHVYYWPETISLEGWEGKIASEDDPVYE